MASSSKTEGWELGSFVAEGLGLDERTGQSIVRLLEEENSVPFIARYRKSETQGMSVDQIRKAEKLFKEAKSIKSKIASVKGQIEKLGKLDKPLSQALDWARSLEEVDIMYSPFKTGDKRSLAERARELGLEEGALRIIQGGLVPLTALLNPSKPGLKSIEEVKKGICHIIADYIIRQSAAQDYLRDTVKRKYKMRLQSTLSKTETKKKEKKETDEVGKFNNYENTDILAINAKPHQILAINRGEKQKVLTVKLAIPDELKDHFCGFVRNRILKGVHRSHEPEAEAGIADCFLRLALPHIKRSVRSQLTNEAELSSVALFARNLRQLLMKHPVKGVHILGVDPGFSHGCKAAIISPASEIEDTFVFRIGKSEEAERMLIQKTRHMGSFKIAVGNGTGCRETETLIAGMIGRGKFKPSHVEYCVVSECGASIYSVTELAEKEMPNLDPNLRSAVSIARRLQNPLAELVKIEPEHLGVGQYQLDLSQKLLKESLDDIVQECVSFAGVDVNTASLQLLQRVSGLNKARAAKVLEYRKKSGRIRCRQELCGIKGIGSKSFQQCAGFVRVFLESPTVNGAEGAGGGKKRPLESDPEPKKRKKTKEAPVPQYEALDSTSIHPESYTLATRILSELGFSKCDVGSGKLMDRAKELAADSTRLHALSKNVAENELTLQQILSSLQQPTDCDFREGFESPLFRSEIGSLRDLKVGQKLTGAVTNLTDFGAFADVGVGRDGLIHISKIRGRKLEVGSRVEVQVLSIEVSRQRFALALI